MGCTLGVTLKSAGSDSRGAGKLEIAVVVKLNVGDHSPSCSGPRAFTFQKYVLLGASVPLLRVVTDCVGSKFARHEEQVSAVGLVGSEACDSAIITRYEVAFGTCDQDSVGLNGWPTLPLVGNKPDGDDKLGVPANGNVTLSTFPRYALNGAVVIRMENDSKFCCQR